MVDFTVDVSELVELGQRCDRAAGVVREELHTAGRQSGFAMVAASVVEAPIRDGNLRNSIGPPDVEVAGAGVKVEVVAHAEYAAAVHDGRKAAEIVPVSRKALRFTVGGEVIFAKRVSQPAREGNPFFVRARAKVRPQIEGFFADATERAARRILGGT